jgi:sn-glycerol 3-phosphate transport system substrate-binding protein
MADKRFFYGGQKYQGPKAEFIAQNAGLYIDSISGIAKLKKAVKDFKWDVAPLPVESWMKAPQNSIIGGASNWVLKGHSKEEYKGVAAFLAFLATNRMQGFWHMETGYFPITLTSYNSLKDVGYFDSNPLPGSRHQTDDPSRTHQNIPRAAPGILHSDPQHHQRRTGTGLE